MNLLFEDPLDGTGVPGWTKAPVAFAPDATGRSVFWLEKESRETAPVAGDPDWKNNRIEVEFYSTGNGWVGLDFNLNETTKTGCNVSLFTAENHPDCVFEFAGWWNDKLAWKLHPFAQRACQVAPETWHKLRIDVGQTIANIYLDDDPEPCYTVYDMPFGQGAVRLMEYHCRSAFRNLKITRLEAGDILPVLPDSWAKARKGEVLTGWKSTLPVALEKAESSIEFPSRAYLNSTANIAVHADKRGVVNLTDTFPGWNAKGVVHAVHKFESKEAGTRILFLTYTDRLQLQCNGERVFEGPPREWFHPERAEHGYSRLIPDQYRVKIPVVAGENILVAQSRMVEPLFGWGFWMRWDDDAE